jgi:hypothetical protein
MRFRSRYAPELTTSFNRQDRPSGKLKGTGLGPGNCKHIIDKHGGKAWIESNEEKEYIFLYCGLIFISLASCAPQAKTVKEEICPEPTAETGIRDICPEPTICPESQAKTVIREICSHRDLLRTLKNSGDFENALKRCQQVLSMSPKTSPGDEALFDMGLIYAHPNPKRITKICGLL